MPVTFPWCCGGVGALSLPPLGAAGDLRVELEDVAVVPTQVLVGLGRGIGCQVLCPAMVLSSLVPSFKELLHAVNIGRVMFLRCSTATGEKAATQFSLKPVLAESNIRSSRCRMPSVPPGSSVVPISQHLLLCTAFGLG